MMTVKRLVSQIITGCSLGQAYCSCVCHLYMLDLKRLEETITGAMKESVSVIWLAEVYVAVPGKTEICSKTWRKHCPIWLCTLFSHAKDFYTPYYFSYNGAILIYFGICQADPDHNSYNVPRAVGLWSILHLLLPEIETN